MKTFGYLLLFVCTVAYFKVSNSQNDGTHQRNIAPLYQLLTRHRRNTTDELQPETTTQHHRRHHHHKARFGAGHDGFNIPPPNKFGRGHHLPPPPPPPGPYLPPPHNQGCNCNCKTQNSGVTESSPASSTSWGPEIPDLDDGLTVIPEPLRVQ